MGVITNIQRFSLHDGPGVRTTVFFKGCPLRCKWCHNPETYSFKPELTRHAEKCIGCQSCIDACPRQALTLVDGKMKYRSDHCAACFACADACPSGGLTVTGRQVSVEDIMAEVEQDSPLYRPTGGGVTLSGGEATAQPEFCRLLLNELKKRNIHAALDTCGYCETELFVDLSARADLILFDLKHTDPVESKRLTGKSNDLILKNLVKADLLGVPIEIRIPLIPGLNDSSSNITRTAEIIRNRKNVTGVVLLGYHKLGMSKIIGFDKRQKEIFETPPSQRLAGLAEYITRLSGVKTSFR